MTETELIRAVMGGDEIAGRLLADEIKKAFRAAWDFMKAHYPPENTLEYWTKAAKDVGECTTGCGEMQMKLMVAVYGYLEYMVKATQEPEDGGGG